MALTSQHRQTASGSQHMLKKSAQTNLTLTMALNQVGLTGSLLGTMVYLAAAAFNVFLADLHNRIEEGEKRQRRRIKRGNDLEEAANSALLRFM